MRIIFLLVLDFRYNYFSNSVTIINKYDIFPYYITWYVYNLPMLSNFGIYYIMMIQLITRLATQLFKQQLFVCVSVKQPY